MLYLPRAISGLVATLPYLGWKMRASFSITALPAWPPEGVTLWPHLGGSWGRRGRNQLRCAYWTTSLFTLASLRSKLVYQLKDNIIRLFQSICCCCLLPSRAGLCRLTSRWDELHFRLFLLLPQSREIDLFIAESIPGADSFSLDFPRQASRRKSHVKLPLVRQMAVIICDNRLFHQLQRCELHWTALPPSTLHKRT